MNLARSTACRIVTPALPRSLVCETVTFMLAKCLVIVMVAASCAALGACSDDSPNGGRGGSGGSADIVASSTEVQSFCEAQCARSAKCGSPPAGATDAGGCVAECRHKLGPLAAGLRADVVRNLAACFPTVPCGQSDDICTDRAIEATGLGLDAALHDPDMKACLAKRDACKGTPGAFSDDDCGTLLMLISSKRTQAVSCFAQAATCDSIPACLSPVFGP